jgi:hypothetical protein
MKRVRIPRQAESGTVSVEATEAIAGALNSGGKTALVFGLILRMVFKYAMAELLGMFMIMQLMVYLPLINVKFPPTALILYDLLI